MYLSVNLLGLFVRGLFSNPELDRLGKEGSDFIKEEIKKSKNADKWVNVVALVLIISYLYVLIHFWNIGVMIVAIMLMMSRFPDLLWEIKNGRKIDKTAPKNAWFYISTILTIGALPALYYSLYCL